LKNQLSIDWDPLGEVNSTVDNFELERAPNRYYGEQLRLSWYDRERRLQACGFGEKEIREAERLSMEVRRRRECTERMMLAKEHLKMFPQLMAQRINHALRWKKRRVTIH
jgi:hypothetical protein